MKEAFPTPSQEAREKNSKTNRNRIIAAVGGLGIVAGGTFGVSELLTSSETTSQRERVSEQGTAFALQALEAIPLKIAQPIEETPEPYDYEITNYDKTNLKPLKDGEKRHLVAATIDLANKEVNVDGRAETKHGITSNIQVTFKLADNNPVLTANEDAPVTKKDFTDSLSNPAFYNVSHFSLYDEEKGISAKVNVKGDTLIPLSVETEEPIAASTEEGAKILNDITNPSNAQPVVTSTLGR